MNTSDSVLVSPVRAFKALSSDDIRRCAPSVFAEHARPGVSLAPFIVHQLEHDTAQHRAGQRATVVHLSALGGHELHAPRAQCRHGPGHVGRTQAVCTCEVFAVNGGEEKLCALAQGTIAAQPSAPDAQAAPSSNP